MGILLPPGLAQPLPPSDAPGFVDLGAGWFWAFPAGGWGVENGVEKPCIPAPETKPGLPGTVSHLPGGEGSGRPVVQIAAPRGSAPGLVAAEAPATRGECERPGAFWWA